ncbi:hypothetical protein [Novosphingobium sp.]|uniref:hypothetical protein n=1 Tax=Novosphingobium sp. TaxID=1874826 RepID=UPI001DDF35C7|nr:hypothetical protein [Novosphingobium sp.]MBX9661919.1 hypothetical protein [Novosphingobium sp.]
MKTTIGRFNAETRTVPVTFNHGGVRHRRPVNACLDDAGNYDAAATAERVEEVASGVAYKIDMGLITG